MEKELKNSVQIEMGVWAHFWLGDFQRGGKGKLYLELEQGGNVSIYGWSKKAYTKRSAKKLEIHIADSMEEAKKIIHIIFPLHPAIARERAASAEQTFHAS